MTLTRRRLLELFGATVGAAVAGQLGCAALPSRTQGVKFLQEDLPKLNALWQGCGLASPLEMTLQDIERINCATGQNYHFRPHTLSYYCIKKAQMEGALPRKGNVMIHIDSHNDFYPPLWETEQMQKVADLVDDPSLHREEKLDLLKHLSVYPLHIENFIVPLLVDGSVSKVYHLKPAVAEVDLPCAPQEWRFRITGKQVIGVTLVESSSPHRADELPTNFIEYWIEEPQQSQHDLYERVRKKPVQEALLHHDFTGESVILDIDYDYFGCMAEPSVHLHSPEEVEACTQVVMRRLAELGVQPKVICQAESPKYTPPGLVPVIHQAVQKNLERYNLLPS